jgi:hypothetical protein
MEDNWAARLSDPERANGAADAGEGLADREVVGDADKSNPALGSNLEYRPMLDPMRDTGGKAMEEAE